MAYIVTGKITDIKNYGAFVLLDDGRRGMIHISEISDSFVKSVSDFLHVGDSVEAVILSDDGNGKIALSIKRLPEKQKDNIKTPPEEYAPTPNPVMFEDMMSKFKSVSVEKINTLKNRARNNKRKK